MLISQEKKKKKLFAVPSDLAGKFLIVPKINVWSGHSSSGIINIQDVPKILEQTNNVIHTCIFQTATTKIIWIYLIPSKIQGVSLQCETVFSFATLTIIKIFWDVCIIFNLFAENILPELNWIFADNTVQILSAAFWVKECPVQWFLDIIGCHLQCISTCLGFDDVWNCYFYNISVQSILTFVT